MRRGSPILAVIERATRPFAALDPAFDAMADFARDRAPWMWLPLTPPDPRKPLPTSAHVWTVTTSFAGAALVEAPLAGQGQLASGRRLWSERAWTFVSAAVLYALSLGAWERRLARRPWWRRLAATR